MCAILQVCVYSNVGKLVHFQWFMSQWTHIDDLKLIRVKECIKDLKLQAISYYMYMNMLFFTPPNPERIVGI